MFFFFFHVGTHSDRDVWCWQMEENKEDFADLRRYGGNKWGEDSQGRQGGDKGRRGAKVPLKDGRRSCSEEHLWDNTNVWIVSFTASLAQREGSEYETQLGRKWQQWKHSNSWMTSNTLEKHCFQVISICVIVATLCIGFNTQLPA